MKASKDHFVFDVRLEDARPQPWRRISLPASSTFLDLHTAIQDACGWGECHLWLFVADDDEVIAGIPDEEHDDPDAESVALTEWFGRRKNCTYLYDFGDAWRHEVKLVERAKLDRAEGRRLLAGELSFPPEDCGGIPGYERCREALETGKDPYGDKEFLEWLGDWRPDRFNLRAAQKSFSGGAEAEA